MAKDKKVIPLRKTAPATSIEAEQSVLGGLMQAHDKWQEVSKIVKESDFSEPSHKLIYAAMRALAEKQIPIDLITLATALEDAGIIDQVGSWAYLGRLERDTPSAANVDYYATIVRVRSLERRRLAAITHNDHHQAAAITAAIESLEATTRAAPLPTINDILDRGVTHDWLVEGWIERHQTAVLFGDSQTCKTLLAIDMACCIATVGAWRGYPTKTGAVLYVVGEGAGGGLTRRFTAWQIANQQPLTDSPLFFQEASTTLPDDLDRLMTEIRQTLEFHHWRLELIVLDTLSRTISGDERSSADFAQYQRALDRLRQTFDCAVLYLHHTGHADKSRERGVSEIGCNADVRLAMDIASDDIRRLRALKIKDADTPPELFFALSPVDLGQIDAKGKPIVSVVLRHLTTFQPEVVRLQPPALRGRVLEALCTLGNLYQQHRNTLTETGISPAHAVVSLEEWKNAMVVEMGDKSERSRARRELIDRGYVTLAEATGQVHLTPMGEKELYG